MLPIASASSQPVAQTEPQEARARLDGLNVLVVDDNADTCEVLRQILISVGASVTVANSVRDGVAQFEANRYDIVLTDLAIPGESGIVLIKYIRGRADASSGTPIIVLSACAFEADREQALSSGGSIFIAKPFKPSEVIRQVRHLTLSAVLKGNSNTKAPNEPTNELIQG
jgi:CheY-like chemotaxis protein